MRKTYSLLHFRIAVYRHPPADPDSPRIKICYVDVSKAPVSREETTVVSQLRSFLEVWGILEAPQINAVRSGHRPQCWRQGYSRISVRTDASDTVPDVSLDTTHGYSRMVV